MKKVCPSARRGYALIYVLLFIVLMLIAVSATWFTGLADLRLSQRSEYSVQAMQLAKAGINDGWLKYKGPRPDGIGHEYPMPDINYPAGACTASKVVRVNPNVEPASESRTDLSPPPPLSDTIDGIYDYRICTDASHITTIEGIGYYKGSKITLKATVNHDGDKAICQRPDPPGGTYTSIGPNCLAGETQISIDHSDDYITVSQSGPSQ